MSELPLYPRCEYPCCSSDARLSGLCELHYWKREAERLDAIASAAVTRVDVVIVERDAANALVALLRACVSASLHGSWQEKANAYAALKRHDDAIQLAAQKGVQ